MTRHLIVKEIHGARVFAVESETVRDRVYVVTAVANAMACTCAEQGVCKHEREVAEAMKVANQERAS